MNCFLIKFKVFAFLSLALPVGEAVYARRQFSVIPSEFLLFQNLILFFIFLLKMGEFELFRESAGGVLA